MEIDGEGKVLHETKVPGDPHGAYRLLANLLEETRHREEADRGRGLLPRVRERNIRTVEDDEARAGSLDELRRKQILNVLEQTGWHQGKASEILGISPSTLYRQLKSYGLTRSRRIQEQVF